MTKSTKCYLILGGWIESEGKVITKKQYQKLRELGIYPIYSEVTK